MKRRLSLVGPFGILLATTSLIHPLGSAADKPVQPRSDFTFKLIVPPQVNDYPDMTPGLRVIVTPTPKAKPSPRSTSRPTLRPRPTPIFATHSGRSATGWASWYCSVGQPVCVGGYPPGSMVAAACGSLRAAMGPDWRGKVVKVVSGPASVVVRLVDWCGSTSKLIDLYFEPMSQLGGTGVLPVTVSW
jgi:hypothetical protein